MLANLGDGKEQIHSLKILAVRTVGQAGERSLKSRFFLKEAPSIRYRICSKELILPAHLRAARAV